MNRSFIAIAAASLLTGCSGGGGGGGGGSGSPGRGPGTGPAADMVNGVPSGSIDYGTGGPGDLGGGTSPDMATSGGGDCSYPAGPFGEKKGDTLSSSKLFHCYGPDAEDKPRDFTSAKDIFDCKGMANINAAFINLVAESCGPCRAESMELPSKEAAHKWKERGVRGIILVGLDQAGNDATVANAKKWRDEYKMTDFWVCDSGKTLPAPDGTPASYIINPRTMKIEQVGGAFADSDFDAIDKMADMNKK